MLRTSPSRTTYVFPSRRCLPCFATSACEPASTRSCQSTTSQRMKPRAMSEWIAPAASRAVSPFRSVHARVSFSPAVKNVIRSSASRSRAGDLVQRRRAAVAERRRLLLRQLGQLGLELQVDAAGAVLDGDERLRRQRLELAGQLARVVDERAAPVDVREHLAQLLELGAQLRVAGLRLLLDALEPPFDMVAVGDEQLELERLEIAMPGRAPRRSRGGRRAARRPDEGSRAAPRRHPGRPGRESWRPSPCARSRPRRARRGADRRSAPCRRSSSRTRRRRPCERGEERRLPAAGRADDADLECHGGRLAQARSRAARAASAATRARGAAAT